MFTASQINDYVDFVALLEKEKAARLDRLESAEYIRATYGKLDPANTKQLSEKRFFKLSDMRKIYPAGKDRDSYNVLQEYNSKTWKSPNKTTLKERDEYLAKNTPAPVAATPATATAAVAPAVDMQAIVAAVIAALAAQKNN